MSGDLDVLDPQATVVEFQGERLEIRPITIGTLPRISRLVRPVFGTGMEMAAKFRAADADDAVLDLLLDMVEQHTGALVDAAALAIGRDLEWVAKADAAEFLTLLFKVVEVNRDFFMKLMAIYRDARMPRALAASRAGVGATPSSTSSSEGTHVPTSSATH